MSWDSRIVRLNIRVSVHDEAGVDQDALCNAIFWRGQEVLQRIIGEFCKGEPNDVEIEVL